MAYKIGVYGSNILENEQAMRLAKELGSVLAQNNAIVVTGGYIC
jgi:predicted Rossmann-fold nucleotide-binding protein